jgi:hypothetical protein
MNTGPLGQILSIVHKRRSDVLISLDGGVWADSAFSDPEFDVVDELEKDASLVQWNQWDKAEADDAIKGLSGSTNDPQLARMMCLSIHNKRFRKYKKRNLQQAVRYIMAFQKSHPETIVAINLDPDNKINPWFSWHQWYDY